MRAGGGTEVTEGHSDEDLKLGGTPERKRGAIRKHCY
jgi:hypothetical protein